MNEKDLRKEFRIPAKDLPEQYSSFTILLAQGLNAEVTTTDLSLGGFGFFTNIATDSFIPGSRLVLYPLGEATPLYGIVVHAAKTVRGSRVGVKLQELGGYRDYRNAIQNIIKDIDSTYSS